MVYERQQATALRLIKKKGAQATYRRNAVPMPPDPDKPWIVGTGSPSESTVSMVFLPANKTGLETFTRMEETSIPKGATLAYMAYNGIQPSVSDTIFDGSKEWRISNFETIAPNGEQIIYILLLI